MAALLVRRPQLGKRYRILLWRRGRPFGKLDNVHGNPARKVLRRAARQSCQRDDEQHEHRVQEKRGQPTRNAVAYNGAHSR